MIEILTMITKLLATIFLLFIILRILGYVYFQVSYFHRSRHLMAFLEKEDVSAWEYLDSHSFLWARNYRKAPYLRGVGMQAFRAKLINLVRQQERQKRFEENHDVALRCFGCHDKGVCQRMLVLTCADCVVTSCHQAHPQHTRLCGLFACKSYIPHEDE